jgi:predicted S18 family serine protease
MKTISILFSIIILSLYFIANSHIDSLYGNMVFKKSNDVWKRAQIEMNHETYYSEATLELLSDSTARFISIYFPEADKNKHVFFIKKFFGSKFSEIKDTINYMIKNDSLINKFEYENIIFRDSKFFTFRNDSLIVGRNHRSWR